MCILKPYSMLVPPRKMSAKVPTVKPRDTRRNGPQYVGCLPMQQPRKWSPQEDELLRLAVRDIGARHWKQVAERVPGRNHVQCLQRYLRVLQPGLKKGHWTAEEDEKLRHLATKGFKSWIEAAEQIPGRSAKQCRDRWRNHLAQGIKHGSWDSAEDALLLELHAKHGNRWAAIARAMPGRTENAVKIHCKSLLARGNGTSSRSASSTGDLDLEDEEDDNELFDKVNASDSEEDPEATTDDLSSISPLPSPMGYAGQYSSPWSSSNVHPHSTMGYTQSQSSQYMHGGSLRTSRVQSFPTPMATPGTMIRRSSFPGAQAITQTPQQSSASMSHKFGPMDSSAAVLSEACSLLDGGSSPGFSSGGLPMAPKPAAKTFNGAIPLAFRNDIPRTSITDMERYAVHTEH